MASLYLPYASSVTVKYTNLTSFLQVMDGAVGALELETSQAEIAELHRALLKLPGMGPFTAANALMLLGRFDMVPADSETARQIKQAHGKTGISPRNLQEVTQKVRIYSHLSLAKASIGVMLIARKSWVAGAGAGRRCFHAQGHCASLLCETAMVGHEQLPITSWSRCMSGTRPTSSWPTGTSCAGAMTGCLARSLTWTPQTMPRRQVPISCTCFLVKQCLVLPTRLCNKKGLYASGFTTPFGAGHYMRAEFAKGRSSSDGSSAAPQPTMTDEGEPQQDRLCSSSAGPLLALAVATPQKTERRKRPRVSREAVVHDLEVAAAQTAEQGASVEGPEEGCLNTYTGGPGDNGPTTRSRARLKVAS